MEQINLESNWDKVFAKNNEVEHKKVTFMNHFGIMLAADMYIPKKGRDSFSAIAVSGPFGAKRAIKWIICTGIS